MLVRGFSALEIAQQAGLIPAYWTEVQFVEWLRQPATDAATTGLQTIATLASQANIVLNQHKLDADSQLAALMTATDAQLEAVVADAQARLDPFQTQLTNFGYILDSYNYTLIQYHLTTMQYLQEVADLIASAQEGEFSMAELRVIADMLALRNFGCQEVEGTGAEQSLALPIEGLARRNVHIFWNGLLQSYENHTIVENAVVFTAPLGMQVQVTIS